MKTYIVIQMQVDSEILEGSNTNISMSNVIRKIEAESKEIAIGKFVIETQNIEAKKKLLIECYNLSDLKSVL